MKKTKRIMLGVGFAFLLLISWILALTADSDADIQRELIDQAMEYIADGVYVLAEPLLEEASGYEDVYTMEAETALKGVYLELMEQSGYRKKYRELLTKQMNREDAEPAIYIEAAEHYFERSDEEEAFEVLRNGIEKTGSEDLVELYESTRYEYSTGRMIFQDVTMTYEGTIQVQQNDKWGIADHTGNLVIPCEYDHISTFYNDRAIAKKGSIISAVNEDNNRLALLHTKASDIGNYGEKRLAIKTSEGWILANGTFDTGSIVFDEIGMYSNGYAAAKFQGKWGVVNTSGKEWLVDPQYDDVMVDILGRCYEQEAVFVKNKGQVTLLVNGESIGDTYEDARPFDDGWAAVKKNGKWGFIDTEGVVQIDYQFDDALSFGQHLAAVKVDGLWGYVSKYGDTVIEPIFLDARSFYQGSAPVKTEDGWRFITLIEYR